MNLRACSLQNPDFPRQSPGGRDSELPWLDVRWTGLPQLTLPTAPAATCRGSQTDTKKGNEGKKHNCSTGPASRVWVRVAWDDISSDGTGTGETRVQFCAAGAAVNERAVNRMPRGRRREGLPEPGDTGEGFALDCFVIL